MPVIQIIAGHSVPYSKNNYLLSEFEDQELYEVPPHVARGMVERGWAKLSTIAPPVSATQPRQPSEPEPAKADDKHDDKPKRGGKA